jgi:hypothetical protein
MTNAEYYDPDDVGNRSPLPEKVTVDYGPHLSPPPSVPASSPSTSPGPEESGVDLASEAGTERKVKRFKKSKPKRKKHKASIGDTVLLTYLDPNRPDIAQKAGQQVLNSASQSEAEDEEEEEEEEEEAEVEVGVEVMGAVLKNGVHNNSSEAVLTAKAAQALAVVPDDDDLEMVDEPQDQPPEIKKEDLPDAPTANGVIHHDREPESSQAFTKPGPPAARSALNVIPPPRQPRPPLVIGNERSRSVEERHRDEDSTPISPTLAKYAMSPSDADPESILPAMQKSPPRSASAHSPEGTQSLPSLHTTLSGLSDSGINGINAPSPFPPSSGHSPQFVRHPTFSSQTTGPSPGAYSQLSPVMSPPGYPGQPGQPSHPSYWRRAPTEGSMSTPSTYEASTPASMSGPSSAQSYPTPNVQDHRGSVEGSSTPQLLNGPLQANGPFTSSTFKCTFAGCTAAPFQTQYLLNSHANVHSSNRPHFCPVADCPRGPGGKGFKRKNEMIRHGLVHQSPGYIW